MANHCTVVMSGTGSFQLGKETRCRDAMAVGDPFIVTPGQAVQANGASDANLSRKRAQYDLGRRATLQAQIFLTDDHTRECGAACWFYQSYS